MQPSATRERDSNRRSDIVIDGETWADLKKQFATELSKTSPHENLGDKTPRFTEPHGKYLYARLSDVHAHCADEWDNLTTVWLSLTADEKDGSGNWVHPLKHDDGFRSNAVKQALYRARRKLDLDQWAGLWVMAPRQTGYSHKHYPLWLDCPQSIEQIRSAFEPVIDSHVRAHSLASHRGNPYPKAIQVRKDGDCDGILAEIGRNIPEIGVETDVRNVEENWKDAQRWAAFYWHDDRIRQYELGKFQEIADDARAENMPSGDWEYGDGWQE